MLLLFLPAIAQKMLKCWGLLFGALLIILSTDCGGSGGSNEDSSGDSEAIIRNFNVAYGVVENETLTLDIYRKEKSKHQRPAVLLLHGGGWVAGDKSENAGLAEGLAGLGYVAFPVNYRLAKEDKNKFPAAIDDVQRAVRWVRAHAEEYSVDPDRIAVLGGSAGAHLASILGTKETRDNSDGELAAYSSRVSCVVSIAGPTDLTAKFPTAPLDVQALLSFALGTYSAVDASPIFAIDQRTAVFLLIHGVKDDTVPVEQAVRFDAALRAAGRNSTLVLLPNSGHGIEDKNDQFVQANATINFLADCLELN